MRRSFRSASYEHGIRDNSGFGQGGRQSRRASPRGFATGVRRRISADQALGLTPGFDVYDDQMPKRRRDHLDARAAADVVVGRALD